MCYANEAKRSERERRERATMRDENRERSRQTQTCINRAAKTIQRKKTRECKRGAAERENDPNLGERKRDPRSSAKPGASEIVQRDPGRNRRSVINDVKKKSGPQTQPGNDATSENRDPSANE